MKRPLAAMAAIALIIPALSAPLHAADALPAPRVIVSGEGEAVMRPDMAVLTLSVMRQAETARAALDANSAAMAEVTAAMKAEGVADRDLQTSGFAINPVYVYPKPDAADQTPRIVGHQVSNTLTVRLRDIARIGALLDRSVTLGINQGGSIAFSNDDPAATITEARTRAVKDAMAKAKTLADAAGVKLGRIVEISEQSYQPQPVPFAAKAARDSVSAAPVPIEAGENAYRVQVNVTLEIAP